MVIEDVISSIRHSDWDGKVVAADQASTFPPEEVLPYLTDLLHSEDHDVRNAAALALRSIGDDSAAESLLSAVFNPANREDRSTLLYALENMEIGPHFREIAELLVDEQWDVRMSAFCILDSGKFSTTMDEIHSAIRLIESSSSLDDRERVIVIDLLKAIEESARHRRTNPDEPEDHD